MRRFLTPMVPSVGDSVQLDEATSHHLLRVTGIAPGEQVEIFDGSGAAAIADLVDVVEGSAILRVNSRTETKASDVEVHLVIAQVRANTMDTVLRMATELGAASVQVVSAERCVAKGDKRERWMRILASAAAQCGRTRVPQLLPPCSLSEALLGREGQRLVMSPGSAIAEQSGGTVHLLVGPEGGFSQSELDAAEEAGWTSAGLGNTTLRADTAAVAAMVRYGG